MTKPVNVEWLQERVADLEAEVKSLRAELQTASDSELLALRNNEGLRKRIVDLEAEVERLRGIDQASIDGATAAFNYKSRDANPHPSGELRVAWWGGYDSAKNAEALRRVVGAVEACVKDQIERCGETGCMCDTRQRHCWSWMEEALAFAKGVSGTAAGGDKNV
jgi:uncharacterized small protein (DUF1192 family)